MSQIYDLFLQAARNRSQIVCNYNGLRREICPHVVGWGLRGDEMALSYQFAGQSSKGLPPGGEWRCLKLQDVRDVILRAGPWHTGNNHSRPQTCVKQVEFEVIV
jgi:hypothetical protein